MVAEFLPNKWRLQIITESVLTQRNSGVDWSGGEQSNRNDKKRGVVLQLLLTMKNRQIW